MAGGSVTGVIGSLVYLSGPIVLTILYSATIMLLFFMVWKGEMKLSGYIIISTIAAFVGLTYALDVWSSQATLNLKGCCLALLAAYAATSRMYVYGHQMKTRNPAIVGAESFIFTSLCVLPLGLWQTPMLPPDLTGWGWTILSGLSLGLGTFGVFYGTALLGAFKVSLFFKIEPLFTSLFSVWFLGEYLKTSQYIGILVVISGLAYYQICSQREKARVQRADDAQQIEAS